MLDFFTIFSKGGILLFCFKGMGLDEKDWESFVRTVNSLNKTVFLQEKSDKKNVFESGSLALRYKLDNEFELVFVVGYQKMLPLTYLDKLLDEIQLRFRDKYAQDLKESGLFGNSTFSDFDREFKITVDLVEKKAKEIQGSKKMGSFENSEKSKKTVASMIIDKNSNTTTSTKKSTSQPIESDEKNPSLDEQPLDKKTIEENLQKLANRQKGPAPFKAKVKSPKPEKPNKKGKDPQKWDPFMFNDGKAPSEQEVRELERTVKPTIENGKALDDVDQHFNHFVPDKSAIGTSAGLKTMDADDSDDETLISDISENKGKSGIWSTLSSLVGSKQLTDADVQPVINKMRDHLIGKNVASEVADNLCQSVASKLEGKVLGSFSTVHRTVKDTLTESLVQLLTPKRRLDILRDVLEAKSNKRPYVITFCGVNGVGKSTNLAKICFWLAENKCSVLIAACDTFRAGAVEQLRTHVKRLNSMYPTKNPNDKNNVELYEKGYGKDAAGIAMEAINHARASHFDVVLVDTAGRMQDNEPLMRSLSKLIGVNDPDLVLFVGEALVGNEAVDQLVKFNRALADHSGQDNPHTIDGIVLTKFDTIDDKVGSAISMTYITGQPIVFVGTGQTYTDLKTINSKAVVQLLMK